MSETSLFITKWGNPIMIEPIMAHWPPWELWLLGTGCGWLHRWGLCEQLTLIAKGQAKQNETENIYFTKLRALSWPHHCPAANPLRHDRCIWSAHNPTIWEIHRICSSVHFVDLPHLHLKDLKRKPHNHKFDLHYCIPQGIINFY